MQQIGQINLDRVARELQGRSTAEIAREIERLQMRFRWAQQLALYARDASDAISVAEQEGSGFFGFFRRHTLYHRNPTAKRAAKLVDSVRQFQPYLAKSARRLGKIDADPTPDFQNDSPAKIWHAFRSWNAFMTEMYTDTGEVRKKLFWRDEIASTAFTFAQITGALAGGVGYINAFRTGGWVAAARAVGTDLARGAVGYTLFREGSMALGLQESRDWDWGEFAIGTLTGAGLSSFGRATKVAAGNFGTRVAGLRTGPGIPLSERFGKFFGVYPNAANPARQAVLVDRFMTQGFTREAAEVLARPYKGMGEHFLPRRILRRFGIPERALDSPLTVLRPRGISWGEMLELHYRVDLRFFGTAIGPGRAVAWSGQALSLERYSTIGKLWFGAPVTLKATGAGAAAASAYGVHRTFRSPPDSAEAE